MLDHIRKFTNHVVVIHGHAIKVHWLILGIVILGVVSFIFGLEYMKSAFFGIAVEWVCHWIMDHAGWFDHELTK